MSIYFFLPLKKYFLTFSFYRGMVFTMNIFFNISELRKRRKLTQQELADKVGCSRESISKYELNGSDMPVSQLVRIADALRVKPEKLFVRK